MQFVCNEKFLNYICQIWQVSIRAFIKQSLCIFLQKQVRRSTKRRTKTSTNPRATNYQTVSILYQKISLVNREIESLIWVLIYMNQFIFKIIPNNRKNTPQ